MKKRIAAILICCALLIGFVPVLPTLAFGGLSVSCGDSVTLPQNEKVTITASGSAAGYQWQIRAMDQWVNISGANTDTLDLSYAMVANLLTDGKAIIRCAAPGEEGAVSGDITVTVDYSTPDLDAAQPVDPSTLVLSDAQVSNESVTAPSQAPAMKAPAAPVDEAEAEALLAAYEDALDAADEADEAAAAAAAQAQEAKAAYDQAAADSAALDAAAAEAAVALTEGDEEAAAAAAAAEEAAVAGRERLADAQAAYEAAQQSADEAAAAAAQAQDDLATAEAAYAAVATPQTTYDLSPDTPATYNVVINYLFENNEIVADPYTASLAAGSNFSATVTFPTVLGYLPFVGENQQNSIELNYTGIDQDYTINVVYKPTNVNYTVVHYQQNVDNDNYTEAERETKQGLTNSTVPEVAKSYEGFYALLYEKPAIAADGSTLVEVYYDRYYYLMNFDLDGGYGVEPVYARYGAPVRYEGTPTKAGYSFKGWSRDGATTVAIPGTMPAENRTYKALWEADATAKVTVVFWGENADDEEYSYIKSAEVNVKPGTEFTYDESGSLVCPLEVHTHDASCGYACNQEEHIHDAACYTLTCTQEVHTHGPSCYTCGLTSHFHDTSCYAGVGSASSAGIDAPRNPQNGYVAREAWSVRGKVIYINGTWYKYTGSTSTENIAPTKCGKTEGPHNHTDACLGCGKTAHTHTDYTGSCYTLTCTTPEHSHSEACQYSCGKTAHSHNEKCYMNDAGLDNNLWKFVKSETVTVAANGSSVVNVYYDRTEKTLTFKYNYSYRNYQSTETITAKWGSNISEQYKKIAANAGSSFWSAETSGDAPYTNYFGVMPETSATYYNRGKSGSDGTMTYWGEDLNGEYTVKLYSVPGVGGYYVSDEDRYEFQGFTYHHGTSNGSPSRGAAFYYTRNSYTLTFNDGYKDVRNESVKYQAPLSTYSSFVPTVPSAYEPGSVVFGGWYLNPECSGAKYELDKHTMPADNVLLYAKWEPVSNSVRFYLDKEAFQNNIELKSHPIRTVPHGSKLDPIPANPTNGSYTFVGWFYMEDGVEKAFDFANMPVNKDLQVYGKWSSNVLKEYTIYYKIKDTDTEIASPTKGSGLAGVTKTFDAKGGTELYTDYQEGYFPVTKSHSMTLDINATEENDTNVYTFWYVQKDAVPYTVKYLNKVTGEPVAAEKTVSDNRKAVVTETFVPVSGMMPDAYQKRLVVSVDENGNPDTEHNVIIFYYTEDTTHAYYKITHYTENLGKDASDNPTWTEYASSQAVGDIGTTYNADPMTIPGFTYDAAVSGTVVSGELTANGLELKLYYTRNSYPYQVRYLEQGTRKQLADPKNGTGKYGQVVSESAIDIAGYTAVDPTSQTLNIRIEESDEAKLNIITFYYKEQEVTINYEVVGPDGCGTVSPTSETLKVLSGTAQGSTPTASENCRFVGWYKDKACTEAVDSTWVTDNKLTPAKTKDYDPSDTELLGYDAATYYAKFEYDLTTLTIVKEGNVADEGFLFSVKDSSGNVVSNVAVCGAGSVTISGLKVNETYTVTENSGWASFYTSSCDHTNGQITLTSNAKQNKITFTNTKGGNLINGGASVANKTTTVPAE